ncbi:hypothetical protein BWL13_01640 [Microbacterium oleivorans]|nr:hypothetical protein BWL13_01640 [Microbacterium oleivorans]
MTASLERRIRRKQFAGHVGFLARYYLWPLNDPRTWLLGLMISGASNAVAALLAAVVR